MAFPYPYSGPIALYNNLPIHSDYYEPNAYFIDDITLGSTTIVTTTENHNYVIGQEVRFIIPPDNGTRQLNGKQGMVIAIPSVTQVTINIDSRLFDTFVDSSEPTQPQILAIGDYNSGNINASGNLDTSTSIPGSYINISPS